MKITVFAILVMQNSKQSVYEGRYCFMRIRRFFFKSISHIIHCMNYTWLFYTNIPVVVVVGFFWVNFRSSQPMKSTTSRKKRNWFALECPNILNNILNRVKKTMLKNHWKRAGCMQFFGILKSLAWNSLDLILNYGFVVLLFVVAFLACFLTFSNIIYSPIFLHAFFSHVFFVCVCKMYVSF